MWKSEFFEIQEFVDPVTYSARGEKSAELIDPRIVSVADLLRQQIGKPVTINNWHTGGRYKESGLRHFATTTGARYSQHKYGRAIDCKVKDVAPEAVREFIRDHWEMFKAVGLTTIEKDTPTWVHLDCRYTGLSTLYEVPFT